MFHVLNFALAKVVTNNKSAIYNTSTNFGILLKQNLKKFYKNL